jgi:hypothetical protein
MLSMNKFLLAAGLLYSSFSLPDMPEARAQGTGEKKDNLKEYRVKLPNTKEQKVLLLIDQANVKIEGYDGDEVILRAPGRSETPERAKGLRPIYYSAEDNSGLGLSVVKDGNTLKIVKASRHHGDFQIRVPRRVTIEYEQVNWMGGDLQITNHTGDLEIKTTIGNIDLKNVSGPVVASTTSGNINVVYATAVEQSKPSSISNISGLVDVTLPNGTKANLKLRSITGEIYSDLDLKMKGGTNTEDLPRLGGGNTVEGTLNGGGVEINLNTISSDIFVRRQK